MSIINATEELELQIKVIGSKSKKVKLAADQYYLLERGEGKTIPVIKHDALIKVADDNGVRIEKTILEFGAFNSPTNFCFIHRSFKTLEDGSIIDEVGEANPKNLETFISGSYPAIMSNKRSQDRLLIRLMGLQGQVYSDVEFSSREESKPENKTETKADNKGIQEAPKANTEVTAEDAKTMVVDYGKYSKNPTTLGELKANAPEDFDWLINTYKENPRSSEKMVKLHRAAKILAKAS